MCAVEWKPLKEIVESISTGLNPRQNFVLNEDYASLYYVTVKEISSNKIVFSENTDKISKEAKNIINKRSKLEIGDILFSGIGTIGKVVYVDIPTSNWDCSESVFILKPSDKVVSGKYLSYILLSDIAKKQYEIGANGSIMKGVRKNTLENILIPIPSLAKQQEIVSHLDTFTTLISNLESELDMRRKQYEHYRNQLLDFEGVEGVEWKTIEDIAEIGTGSSNTKDELDNGLYPFFVRSQQVRWQNKYEYDETAIITSGDGVGVGKIFHYIEGKYALHQRAYRIHILDTRVVVKYVYNYMKCKFYDYIMMNAYSSSVTSVRRPMLLNFEVPIPSSKTQQEIVEKLDAFENLIQSLDQEIKLRKQQYEYYREKLLTFEKE